LTWLLGERNKIGCLNQPMHQQRRWCLLKLRRQERQMSQNMILANTTYRYAGPLRQTADTIPRESTIADTQTPRTWKALSRSQCLQRRLHSRRTRCCACCLVQIERGFV